MKDPVSPEVPPAGVKLAFALWFVWLLMVVTLGLMLASGEPRTSAQVKKL